MLLLAGRPSAQGVRDWVDGAGAAAPLAFIVVSATLTCALFPGPLLAGASGLLFGTALGFPLSLTAAVLGACLAFSISRAVGARPGRAARGPARCCAARALVSRRGFVSVLYARIAPGMPYSLVNYAAGLTAIPLGTFAAATALGAAPRAFAYTALGGSLGNLRSPEAYRRAGRARRDGGGRAAARAAGRAPGAIARAGARARAPSAPPPAAVSVGAAARRGFRGAAARRGFPRRHRAARDLPRRHRAAGERRLGRERFPGVVGRG